MKSKEEFFSKRSESQALVPLVEDVVGVKGRGTTYALGPPLFRCTRALRCAVIFEAEDQSVFRPSSYNTQQRRIMRFRVQ